MCGVMSISSHHGERISPESVLRGLQSMCHRGPDDTNFWAASEGDVVLGHNRLSIMGLDNGRQPISSEDDRIHVVVNGEFYGYEDIRRSLMERGAKFRSESDSEILIHLYRHYGVRGFQFLRGEYAFVLYDADQRTLFAVRDRLGVKPLFYGINAGSLYVGSEIKSLIAAGFPANWDTESYIGRQFYLSNQTLFAGIQTVRPGHILESRASYCHQHPYWQLRYPSRSDPSVGSNALGPEAITELRSLIVDSVRTRLRSDVPVAFYLSGGIDSSAMLGIASHVQSTSPQGFHVAFDEGSGYDESAFAREAAAHCGASLTCLPLSPDDLADNFEDAVWHNETPFFNAHGVAKYLLSRQVRDAGFKVVVTGEGADEVFGGYPHFRRDMVLYNTEGQDPEIIANLREKIEQNDPISHLAEVEELAILRKRVGHGISWIDNQSNWLTELRGLYGEQINARYSRLQPFLMAYERLYYPGFEDIEPVHRSMSLWAQTYLPNFVLTTLGDRMEMAHSIEGRVPLLDHHVVEYAAKLPVSLKINGGVEKYVFREAVKPFVPRSLYSRKKHYFRTPPASLCRDSKLYQMVLDILSSYLVTGLPFFDPSRVKNFIDTLSKRSRDEVLKLDPVLMELTSLCFLQKKYALSS